MKTFKILSALLTYPSQDLIMAAPEFRAVLDSENLVPAVQRRALDILIEQIATGELYDLQEDYGLLFDRSRTLALHLFEHVHGESRDRGQAMVSVSFSHAGQRIQECRILTQEELNKLPPNMRKPEDCPR